MKQHTPIPPIQSKAQALAAFSLSSLLLLYPFVSISQLSAHATDNSIQIRGGLTLTNGQQKIPDLSLRDADIKDVLYTLAKLGQFNIVVDSEVDGEITVDLHNVTIAKTFEHIMALSNLTYVKDGETIVITTQDKGTEQTLNKMVLKSLSVHYSNAADLVSVLNSTIFSVNRPGGNTQAIAAADPRTNSILVMGNESDVELAQRALAELDFPLQHKTFLLKNAPANDVATAIAQTLFGVSLSASNALGGNNAGGNSNGGANAATGNNNNAQATGAAAGGGATGNNVQAAGTTTGGGATTAGGTGTTGGGTGTTGGASGATGGGSGTGDTLTAGRGVQVFTAGPMTFITNNANNTMTLLGTTEQIALAENLIYDLDIRPPQVAVEVALIQLSETKDKTFNAGLNTTNGLDFLLGELGFTNIGGAASIFWNRFGESRNTILQQATANSQFGFSKARILARPTIVAVSGTTSTVNLTNEVFGGFNTTIVPGTTSSISRTPIIKTVGLTLSVTPQVANNGTVNLSIQPNISAPGNFVDVQEDTGVTNRIQLLSSSSLQIGDARVQDGETLILGGLIQDLSNSSVQNKMPLLGDIPIIGSLFRDGHANNTARNELLVLVTPHIIREDGVPYFRQEWKERGAYHSLTYDDHPAPTQQVFRQPASAGYRPAPVQTPNRSYPTSSNPYLGTQQQQQFIPSYNQVLK